MAHQVLELLQQKPQQCGAIKLLNLFNKYLLPVTFETDDNYSIRLKISNNGSTIRFDSKWKKYYSHSTSPNRRHYGSCLSVCSIRALNMKTETGEAHIFVWTFATAE